MEPIDKRPSEYGSFHSSDIHYPYGKATLISGSNCRGAEGRREGSGRVLAGELAWGLYQPA